MIRWDWRPPKKCTACEHWRDHDNHKTLEACNSSRPGDPCLKPNNHHSFVMAVVPPTEPRRTIVHEMASAWKFRAAYRRLYQVENREEHWQRSYDLGARLDAIRRIWHACREETD